MLKCQQTLLKKKWRVTNMSVINFAPHFIFCTVLFIWPSTSLSLVSRMHNALTTFCGCCPHWFRPNDFDVFLKWGQNKLSAADASLRATTGIKFGWSPHQPIDVDLSSTEQWAPKLVWRRFLALKWRCLFYGTECAFLYWATSIYILVKSERSTNWGPAFSR